MKFLQKTFNKSTKKSKGSCDRCSVPIWEGDRALCFHTDVEELYLCEVCVEVVREEFIAEDFREV
jgi:hypothetical protein